MVLLPNFVVKFTSQPVQVIDPDTGNLLSKQTFEVEADAHVWRDSPSPFMIQNTGLIYDWSIIYDTDLVYPMTDGSVKLIGINDRVSFEDIPGHTVAGTIRSIHTSWGPSFNSTTAHFKEDGT